MADDNNLKNFSSSDYLNLVQEQMERLLKKPELLQEAMGSFMKLQQGLATDENIKNALIGDNTSVDGDQEGVGDYASFVSSLFSGSNSEVDELKKRIELLEKQVNRLNRRVFKPKIPVSSTSGDGE